MKENRLVKSQIPLRKAFFLKTNNNKQIGTIKTKLTEGANSATFGDCKGLFGWKVILLALDWELLGEDGTVRQDVVVKIGQLRFARHRTIAFISLGEINFCFSLFRGSEVTSLRNFSESPLPFQKAEDSLLESS